MGSISTEAWVLPSATRQPERGEPGDDLAAGLRRIGRAKGAERDEAGFLDPLHEQIQRGKSPGEEIAERWRGEWGMNRKRLIEATRY